MSLPAALPDLALVLAVGAALGAAARWVDAKGLDERWGWVAKGLAAVALERGLAVVRSRRAHAQDEALNYYLDD